MMTGDFVACGIDLP